MEPWEIFISILAFVAILLIALIFHTLNKWKRWGMVESESIRRLIHQIPEGDTPELTIIWYEYTHGFIHPASPFIILLSPHNKYRTILDQYATALSLAEFPVMLLSWDESRGKPVNFANIASKVLNIDGKSKLEPYSEMAKLRNELDKRTKKCIIKLDLKSKILRQKSEVVRNSAKKYLKAGDKDAARNLIGRETKWRTKADRYQNIIIKLEQHLDELDTATSISPEKVNKISEEIEKSIANIEEDGKIPSGSLRTNFDLDVEDELDRLEADLILEEEGGVLATPMSKITEKERSPHVNRSKFFVIFRSVTREIISSVSCAAKDPRNQWILISPEIGDFGKWEIFSGNGNNIRVLYSLDSPKSYLHQIQVFIAKLKIPAQNLAPFPMGGLNLAKQETVSLAKIISWLSIKP